MPYASETSIKLLNVTERELPMAHVHAASTLLVMPAEMALDANGAEILAHVRQPTEDLNAKLL